MRFPSFRGEPEVRPGAEVHRHLPRAAPVLHFEPDFLVRLAEEVWRLARRADRAAELVGGEALNPLQDSVARLRTVLADNRIEIHDPTGEPYHEGLRLTVLHVEGQTDAGQPLWIRETVRPTVLVDGEVHSAGQVMLSVRQPGTDRV